MDTSQFDSKIQELETDNNNLRSEMDAVKTSLIEAANSFVLNFTKENVEEAVKSKPEHTKSLGVDKLKNLKAELNKILDELPNNVKQQLDENSLWTHLSALPADIHKRTLPAYDLKDSFTRKFEEAIREVLGHTGHLLITYEYEKPGDRHHTWSTRPDKLPRYNYGLGPNTNMSGSLKSYTDLLERYVKNHIEIKRIEKQKSEAEAQNLWDSI